MKEWESHIHTLGNKARVCMTGCMESVLTTGGGVGNTAYYLQHSELEASMRETWHRLYVDCGTVKHDELGFVLLKEGVCTCDSDASACPLAKQILQLDDLLQQMRGWMMSKRQQKECPCIVSPALHTYDANCKHCKGTGVFFSKHDEWRICRELSTFLLCGVLATGHTIDRYHPDCGCADSTSCKTCDGSGQIVKVEARRANAEDIIPLVEEFAPTKIYDAQTHPRFHSDSIAKWLREYETKNPGQLILLSGFRPMLSKCCFTPRLPSLKAPVAAALTLFMICCIPGYKDYFASKHSLTKKRLDRSMLDIESFVSDVVRAENNDKNGYLLGSPVEVYKLFSEKTASCLFAYLHFNMDAEEIALVFEK